MHKKEGLPSKTELSEVRGMERKGTVKVRPNWMFWEVVPVSPRNLVRGVPEDSEVL